MISSASAQIEATGGDHMKTTIIKNGQPTVVPDYARVQGILIGIVSVYIIILALIGPECVPSPLRLRHCPTLLFIDVTFSHVNRNHGSDFAQHGAAFSEGVSDSPRGRRAVDEEKSSDTRSEEVHEKR